MPARPQRHPLARPATTPAPVMVDHAMIQTRTDATSQSRTGATPQPRPDATHLPRPDATHPPRPGSTYPPRPGSTFQPRRGATPQPGATPGARDLASEPNLSQRASLVSTSLDGQDGSVAMEYGLLAVVAATVVSVVLEWATGGGITSLLEAVIGRVGEIVGL